MMQCCTGFSANSKTNRDTYAYPHQNSQAISAHDYTNKTVDATSIEDLWPGYDRLLQSDYAARIPSFWLSGLHSSFDEYQTVQPVSRSLSLTMMLPSLLSGVVSLTSSKASPTNFAWVPLCGARWFCVRWSDGPSLRLCGLSSLQANERNMVGKLRAHEEKFSSVGCGAGVCNLWMI